MLCFYRVMTAFKIRFLGKAYAYTTTGIANLITSGLEKLTGKKFGRTSAEQMIKDPFGNLLAKAGGITTATLGIATLPTTAPIIGKGALSFAIKQPLIALVGAGLVTTKPGRELIVSAGKGLFKGGKELGVISGKLKKEGKELTISQGLKTAGLLGMGLAGGVLLPKVIPKVIPKIKNKVKKIEGLIYQPKEQLTKSKPVGIEGESPILPERTKVTTGKRSYKKRRAKKQPSVKQSVKINIINRPTGLKITNRNYLNEKTLI